MKRLDEIKGLLKVGGRRVVSIAAAGDVEVIEAVSLMLEAGAGEPVLFGDAEKIRRLAEEAGLYGLDIVPAQNDAEAALAAAECVREGKADILMKGLLNTSDFMRGVLDKERGIRGEGILSHLAVFEVPVFSKLMFITDGGINPYPSLDEKAKILANAVAALHSLGVGTPNVAALSANEAVNPKVVSSTDADALAKMNAAGGITGCIVEGPMAMDVALSSDAAVHKGIESRISGEVDIFLAPNIDVGNITGKALQYGAGAKMAGVVLGARAPIVLASRSDSAQSKYMSMLLALAIAG
ncbi:MAG: phosphate acyltransferase [Clostridiales bacterium]|nr:phosphate acyltransferase [Clostridiales bacterium]